MNSTVGFYLRTSRRRSKLKTLTMDAEHELRLSARLCLRLSFSLSGPRRHTDGQSHTNYTLHTTNYTVDTANNTLDNANETSDTTNYTLDAANYTLDAANNTLDTANETLDAAN